MCFGSRHLPSSANLPHTSSGLLMCLVLFGMYFLMYFCFSFVVLHSDGPVRSSGATLSLVVILPSGRELRENRATGGGESCLEWIFRVGWTSPNVQARSDAAMQMRGHRDSGCGGIRTCTEKSKLIPSLAGRYYENTKLKPEFLIALTTGGQERGIADN
jgi:hypothetical protein